MRKREMKEKKRDEDGVLHDPFVARASLEKL
jgi:hypothetical protein